MQILTKILSTAIKLTVIKNCFYLFFPLILTISENNIIKNCTNT